MPTLPPSSRTAVVTGGASGIGSAIARRLAAEGSQVAILDVDLGGAEDVAATIARQGGTALAVRADVADGASVGEAMAAVRERLGAVHVLVNNAGVCSFAPFDALLEAEWDRTMAVIVKGTYHCTRAALPDMRAAGWGRIVNVSSLAGIKGAPALAHYAAAKAAIVGFTKALATELGAHGITVNAIAPGLVDTPLLDKSGLAVATREQIAAALPIPRIGTPDDIAAACSYLASPDAAWTTGQVLSPNGGGYM